ncbi:PepSY domain-containing protein [Maribacter sp. CXY002]|uniref:PepSY domain-containing protein n=1 Tax=Maribacter luteocoastalis TaxID=3407671 RepID=UPI003B6798EC
MVKRKIAVRVRKAHRYLGLFLGVQFLMWTISGLYFSWTDIDEIHGDHFRKPSNEVTSFKDLKSPSDMVKGQSITSVELRSIAGKPFYWINRKQLFDAQTGIFKKEISKDEALSITKKYMLPELKVSHIERIEEVGRHSEYRGRPLPAYAISYDAPENIVAYVSVKDGAFQALRHRDWRWFDFLWMTHTMDYKGRDDFNTLILRTFSLLGLVTVLSGFLLWFTSSPTVRKIKKK